MDSSNVEKVVAKEIELHQQLKNLDCIGFDMDMTIVRYHNVELQLLVNQCMSKTLAPKFPHLANDKLELEICHRGIILDLDTGYILKLGSNKRVLKAFFGSQAVDKKTILETYESQPIPENRPLHSFNGSSTSRFFALISYFDIPAASLWVHHIDHLVKQGVTVTRPLMLEFLQALIDTFNIHFTDFYKGEYYEEFRKNPGKFVIKATEKCKNWLRELKNNGTKVLLITNSKSEYTDLLMKYCYGEDFQDLFDLVVADAKKPDFFKKDRPFYDLESYFPKVVNQIQVDEVVFNKKTVYNHGNVKTLMDQVRKSKGKSETDLISFCYVGDHLIGDVSVPKQFSKWMTIAIVEEIEDPNEIVVLKKKTNYKDGNRYEWGSFFHFHEHDSQQVPIETYWSSIVRENADIMLGSVETLAEYFHQDKFDKQSLQPCAVIYQNDSDF
ncbi:putative 5'-nucleotidase [Cavenderia fasciculata]|uniref:5'-nucleotidase n=1 Tax=Cavenderia fasciculata TaxID=261658 RepID=F4Q8X7_CACFS|nr:putative 5'-nucleotidase [Cavenderia fasciculata]EGG15146.1 putative 5'-nucleotidase [Cavenderia fasciculata]|eukprot:XP_004351866.1 putative 5'-nucleotidase [Cavenderia fasciculata]